MTDNLTPEDRRKTMQAVKGKGTSLEKRLWAILANMGVKGWKKNLPTLPGKPDVVFLKNRIAIFIDGCFWHGCPRCRRKLPQTRRSYWKRKIQRNVELAALYERELQTQGWTVIRIWEHEMNDLELVKQKILRSLKIRASTRE